LKCREVRCKGKEQKEKGRKRGRIRGRKRRRKRRRKRGWKRGRKEKKGEGRVVEDKWLTEEMGKGRSGEGKLHLEMWDGK
jgi:hypothetical protein